MYASTSRLLLRFLIAVLFASVLGGCGQKGPLYLPDKDDDRASPSN